MFNQTLGYFDATADITEYGLIAFASPEFIDEFVKRLAQSGADAPAEEVDGKGQPCTVAA